MLRFDIELTDEEATAVAACDRGDWFTGMAFGDAASPRHPEATMLDANNELKQELLHDWIEEIVPGKSVLDTFAANGGFAVLAAQAGARSVTGVEFSQGRVEVARLVARILESHNVVSCPLSFEKSDIYQVAGLFSDPFDVSMVLGGLYHIADPPYILDQVRGLTREWMIIQTDSVLPDRGNVAFFRVRDDQTDRGLSSVRGGRGTWHYSVECLREIVRHAQLEIVAEQRPERKLRKRFPWWCALARPFD